MISSYRKRWIKILIAAWIINGIMFVCAWFGGDIAIHSGYVYLEDSISAMRFTLTLTKFAITFALAVTAIPD